MKNQRGYTVVELIVVIAVVGIFSFAAINKASYAFSDNTEATKELEKQKALMVENAAVIYGEEKKEELFSDTSTIYIRVKDLKEQGYLFTSDEIINDDQKIKLELKEDKVKVYLEG